MKTSHIHSTDRPFDPQLELPVMEHFPTLQGEGFHQGKAAYFVRLAGCDVGCVWCDVKESWPMDSHPLLRIDELVAAASQHPARMVVITGGEPTLHPLGPLTEAFQAAGFRTHIETAGVHPLSGHWDWVCLSPKKFKAALPEVAALADELKVIVYHRSDPEWGQAQAQAVGAHCHKFLQPEWSKREEVMPLIANFVQRNPDWRATLQTHKYFQIP